MVTDLAKWCFFNKIKQKVWRDFLKWYNGDYTDVELYYALNELKSEINGTVANWKRFEDKFWTDLYEKRKKDESI